MTQTLQAIGVQNKLRSTTAASMLNTANPTSRMSGKQMVEANSSAALATRSASFSESLTFTRSDLVENAQTALAAIQDSLEQMLGIATEAATGTHTAAQIANNLAVQFHGYQPLVANILANTRNSLDVALINNGVIAAVVFGTAAGESITPPQMNMATNQAHGAGPPVTLNAAGIGFDLATLTFTNVAEANNAITLVTAAIGRVASIIARLQTLGEVFDTFSEALLARQASAEDRYEAATSPDIAGISAILAELGRAHSVIEAAQVKANSLNNTEAQYAASTLSR